MKEMWNPLRKEPDEKEMKQKLRTVQSSLGRLAGNKQQSADKAREQAREAFREGNERRFRRYARKHQMNLRVADAADTAALRVASWIDQVELYESLKTLGGIGGTLREFQEELGLDTETIEDGILDLQLTLDDLTGHENVMDALEIGLEDQVDPEEVEALRAEFAAEMGAEVEGTDDVADRIRKDAEEIQGTPTGDGA